MEAVGLRKLGAGRLLCLVWESYLSFLVGPDVDGEEKLGKLAGY